MPEFTEILPQSSDFWEACARHTTRRTCRTVRHIYLCDLCAKRLTKEAFNDRSPIYHGETVNGYCGLCNQLKDVTLRLWFACDPCWNVIIAYQKTFVASQAVHAFWREQVQPEFPTLCCVESEVVEVTTYAHRAKTKKQLAEELDHLDFQVSDSNIEREPTPLFHIELKTGPSSMSMPGGA